MATEFQPTQFQPVSLYDLPTLAFSQLAEGEATRKGFLSGVSEATGIGNSTLTPNERESLLSEYKTSNGVDGISGALVDIATNPWVWLAFLTTPGGMSAIKAGVKGTSEGIFKVAPKFHTFVREEAPRLVGWNFLTANQAFRNTQLLPAMKEVATERANQLNYFNESITPATEKVIANLRSRGIKVTSLDPKKAPIKHRELLEDLDAAIHGRLSGMDRNVTRTVTKPELEVQDFEVEYVINGRQAKAVFNDVEDARARISVLEADSTVSGVRLVAPSRAPRVDFNTTAVQADAVMNPLIVDDILRQNGAEDLVTAYRSYYDETAKRMFLQDDLVEASDLSLREIMSDPNVAKEFIDEDKVVNLYRSNAQRGSEKSETLFSIRDDFSDDPGMRTIQEVMNLVGSDARMAFRTGEVSDVVKNVMANNLGNGFYHPKMYDNVNEMGSSLLKSANRTAGKQVRGEAQAIAAGQTMPRHKEYSSSIYSQEDLQVLRRMSGDDAELLENVNKLETRLTRAANSAKAEGTTATVSRLGVHDAAQFYSNNMANSYSLFIHGARRVGRGTSTPGVINYSDVWEETSKANKNSQKFYDDNPTSKTAGERNLYDPDSFGGTVVNHRQSLNELPIEKQPFKGQRGYYTFGDAINQVDGSVREASLRGIIKDTLVPQMLGRSNIANSTENMLVHQTALGAKSVSSLLKNIKLDKTELGKKVIGALDDFAEKPAYFVGAGQNGGIARYLYMTHLGFNPAAVVLNLTQPWLLGATYMGVGNTIKAYGQAMKEMGGYMSDRLAVGGLNIDDATKVALIRKNFSHADDLGIGPDVINTLDNTVLPTSPVSQGKTRMQKFSDLSLKLFEKGEWMNRLVTAHATDNLYKSAGKFVKTGPLAAQRRNNVREMIQETQFGADFLNTPFAFMGGGPLGQYLGRPEVRQFLTFPVRSVTGLLTTSKQINEGRRTVMGFDMPFGRTADFMRGMGISASLYYAGRNMFEADMQKGLFFKSLTDITGNDAFSSQENITDFIPVPPVIDLGWDMTRGLTTGENDLVANSIWRMVPGGIALSRTVSSIGEGMGFGRDNPVGKFGQFFQRRYAAYDKRTPTGEVPIFKGDGTFLEFRNPMQLIMQGVGLDLNKSQVRSEETGYYVKQREMILDYRREIITRLMANDISGAMRKKAEYEKRMGIPFTVTKGQLRGFMRNRMIPRNERILDRIPKEARPMYARYAANDMINKDVDPSVFIDAASATARGKEMGRPETFDLQPEAVKELKALMEGQKEQAHQKSMSFTQFVPYGFQ